MPVRIQHPTEHIKPPPKRRGLIPTPPKKKAPASGGSPPVAPVRLSGPGLRVRLSAIKAITDAKVLKSPLYLQTGPLEEWELDGEGSHVDVDTATSGEYSHAGSGPKLQTTTIQSLLLSWDAPWLTAHVDDDYVLAELTRIREARTPFDVLVLWQNGRVEMHMDCTLRNFKRRIKSGEPDARYIDLDLKQWRDSNPKRVGLGRTRTKLPTTHQLKAVDTLYSLSKKYYGSYDHWREIAAANGIKNWGSKSALYKRPGYRLGRWIKIPALKAKR